MNDSVNAVVNSAWEMNLTDRQPEFNVILDGWIWTGQAKRQKSDGFSGEQAMRPQKKRTNTDRYIRRNRDDSSNTLNQRRVAVVITVIRSEQAYPGENQRNLIRKLKSPQK